MAQQSCVLFHQTIQLSRYLLIQIRLVWEQNRRQCRIHIHLTSNWFDEFFSARFFSTRTTFQILHSSLFLFVHKCRTIPTQSEKQELYSCCGFPAVIWSAHTNSTFVYIVLIEIKPKNKQKNSINLTPILAANITEINLDKNAFVKLDSSLLSAPSSFHSSSIKCI